MKHKQKRHISSVSFSEDAWKVYKKLRKMKVNVSEQFSLWLVYQYGKNIPIRERVEAIKEEVAIMTLKKSEQIDELETEYYGKIAALQKKKQYLEQKEVEDNVEITIKTHE